MRKHRGLSAIVGTIFLVAVMVSALSYVSYSMNVLGNFSESLITEEKKQKDKQGEEIQIGTISVTPSNKLNAVIKNTGDVTVKIKTLWVYDINDSTKMQKYSISKTIPPGTTVTIGNDLAFTMNPTKGYNIKLITERGKTESFYVNSGANEHLNIRTQTIPETIPVGFTTTVLLMVNNNMTNHNVLYNITPSLSLVGVGSPTVTLVSGPEPTSYPSLAPGDTATFRYSYKIDGNTDDSVSFNGTIANAKSGDYSIKTVTLTEITQATQSGTAVTSLGFSSQLTNQNLLYLHSETVLTPSSSYRLDRATPDTTGVTINPSASGIKFYTSNMTIALTVPDGNWNIPLEYYNNLVPSSVPAPTYAYMFSCDNCGDADNTIDSMGSALDLDKAGGSDTPAWVSSGGPDGKPYYSFAGKRMTDTYAGGNLDNSIVSPEAAPDSMVIWARIPDVGADDYQTIVRLGKEGAAAEDSWDISVGDGTPANNGKIVFRHSTDLNAHYTTCMSNAAYDTNKWLFIAAVRPALDQCTLYINATKQTPEDTATGGTWGSSVDVDYMGISYDGTNSASELGNGDVGLVMSWNNNALTATQVYDLWNTNYGTNGTRIDVKLEETDGNGVLINTIKSDLKYRFNFNDPAKNSDASTVYGFLTSNATDQKYDKNNYTATLTQTLFSANNRLRLTLSMPSATQNLPMNIRIDDSSFTLPGGSYIQTPIADTAWPAYLTWASADKPIYYAFNSGPTGSWFTYAGTRLVLTTSDHLLSYGGLIEKINGTKVDTDHDSLFIPDQGVAQLSFYPISNPPQVNPATNKQVPPGIYDGAVFLSGYDEAGQVFLRTVKLGTIQITQ